MNHALHPLDIIIKKRDGHELTKSEIEHFIHAVVLNGEQKLAGDNAPQLSATDKVTDAQIASFLMAVFQQKLSPRELADLTTAMRFSGETFDASGLDTFTVDKHSTGGVGDKSSLLIAPIVAAAGLQGSPSISVPMISGRSLGHTGGTLDKLETVPGLHTQLSLQRMTEVLRECHAVMMGQTPRLVPADRILYALRDHTGTVESPYLITASIMSKKLAAGLDALVLDVKTGSGAFMSHYADAQVLASLMVETGELAGTRTVALLTSMDQPLGRYSGNWVEVQECVELFQHFSPDFTYKLTPEQLRLSQDLLDLTHALAGQ